MQFWKGMTDEERASVRNHLRKSNIDLDIPDLILTDMSAFTLKVCNFNADPHVPLEHLTKFGGSKVWQHLA